MGLFESFWGDHFPYTNYQELNMDWLLKQMKHCIHKVKELFEEVQSLKSLVNDNMESAFTKWLEASGDEMIRTRVNSYISLGVQFGLDDNGYFVAYYPTSWQGLQFGTTELDVDIPCEQEYGHLAILYGNHIWR